jgi:hypothetical protein
LQKPLQQKTASGLVPEKTMQTTVSSAGNHPQAEKAEKAGQFAGLFPNRQTAPNLPALPTIHVGQAIAVATIWHKALAYRYLWQVFPLASLGRSAAT